MDLYRSKIMDFLQKSNGKDIFIFDTETTGIPGKHPVVDILQFSCIKIGSEDGKRRVVDTLNIFINPGYPIPDEILAFNEANGTGITQEKINKEGLTQKEAVKIIKEFWGESPYLMGYNSISFDEPLVKDLYQKGTGEEFAPAGHIDVLRMAREKFPSPAKGSKVSHRLSDMVSLLGCNTVGFHAAIEDCKATYEVFKKIIPLYKEEEHPEEPYLSIDNFRVLRVSPWKQSYQMRRIYVANTVGSKMYYDVYNRLWVIPGHLPEDDVIEKVYDKVGVADDREFDSWAMAQF